MNLKAIILTKLDKTIEISILQSLFNFESGFEFSESLYHLFTICWSILSELVVSV